MWKLKQDTNELVYKTETGVQILKTNGQLSKGKHGGGINQELGMNTSTLPYINIR